MPILVRSILSLVLVILALVTVNLVRFTLSPREARSQGADPISVRNGDVDCDGQINITDPIVTLNWLFGTGPEPCAIAQTDACCTELREDVAAIRASLEVLSARIPSPDELVTLNSTVRFESNETKTILDVPDDKRFVVTSFASIATGLPAKLVNVVQGNATEFTDGYPSGLNSRLHLWPSGFALPLGADVALQGTASSPLPSDVTYFLTGYLSGD